MKLDTLTHYTQQATLAGDAEHLAALISRHPYYSPAALALLITALSGHAVRCDNEGLARMDEVVNLLDDAAGICEQSYVMEHAL